MAIPIKNLRSLTSTLSDLANDLTLDDLDLSLSQYTEEEKDEDLDQMVRDIRQDLKLVNKTKLEYVPHVVIHVPGVLKSMEPSKLKEFFSYAVKHKTDSTIAAMDKLLFNWASRKENVNSNTVYAMLETGFYDSNEEKNMLKAAYQNLYVSENLNKSERNSFTERLDFLVKKNLK